jgi:methyl-accepting chemotaxis protein
MIENTRRQTQIIEHIAGGDLTVSLQARSEKDIMNNALISMLDMNNHVFSNISRSADQVAIASQQIADSSQALAQGSTEQAASVQELSSAIAEIAHKTKTNADMAGDAAELADTIRSNAEKGSRQMTEMIGAVKDINQSSLNISRVMKVIDDIAFQTNILALNAAVEAARAGAHGKGFAVVAEEVRNLASKSAEAANDTGAMIQDSMSKAEFGSRIADETAVSLAEIISGIDESGKLIAEIARSSEEQSSGITQVNIGIDQVAQVVQQNSATAQESAAAAEEMSGQSSMLQGLISQFKLKDENTRRALPVNDPKRLAVPGKTEFTSVDAHGEYGKY